VTPAHRQPRLVAVVAAGGALGTALRYGLTDATGPIGGWPTATFAANLVGSVLLGALLERLARAAGSAAETPRHRLMRLGLGTGLLGGFTTFSSLAVELERMLADGATTLAAAYAGASAVGGVLAALLGVALAARHHRWRTDRLPRDPDQADLLPADDDATARSAATERRRGRS
jgi:CrcB protein